MSERVLLTRKYADGSTQTEGILWGRVQSGDRLHFDANAIRRALCPACVDAVRADGILEPAWVVAKLSFLDGVTGMVGVSSLAPGTYDLVLGDVASGDFLGWSKRWYYLTSSDVRRMGMKWLLKLASRTAASALNVQSGIEYLGMLDRLSRVYFVNLKSVIYGESDPVGVSKLITLEGEGTLFRDRPAANLGAVPAGYTAELVAAEDIPRVRPSSEEETRLASAALSFVDGSCARGREQELHNNNNPYACAYTQTAGFDVVDGATITRIGVWYDTRVGGSSLDFTLRGPNKSLSGVFNPTSCDPIQTHWCMGEASINQSFVAGTYTVATGKAAICQNSISKGNGFSVVNGCPGFASAEVSPTAYSRNYVQKAYVAYYGRPADPAGQLYWAGRLDGEGGSLNAIIGAFGYSDEFNRRYGGLSNAGLVTKIYQQALAREPDSAGLAWYVAELEAGRRTLQTITLDVLNGATTAPDSTVVANKLEVAAYYTASVLAGCAYGTEQDGVGAIATVTANAATVATAKAAIDARCGY